MCNCLKEKIKEMKEATGCKEITPPIDYLSGRLYLPFFGEKPGVKKKYEIPLLLEKCPFCGKAY
ncbi:hypothetical protein [uncultured Robinsoniella sp.]|uniref:hypothetical protein n=1 Tax=uncultured Robinsoniella sp. TaxID=904190 RepID=UPI0029070635|nr:hypothetical protein [Clostridiales bacterium]